MLSHPTIHLHIHPITHPLTYLPHTHTYISWLDGFYAFQYIWAREGVPVDRQTARIEAQWCVRACVRTCGWWLGWMYCLGTH